MVLPRFITVNILYGNQPQNASFCRYVIGMTGIDHRQDIYLRLMKNRFFCDK
jgi:hypothetical protein